jgi:hypothetical protein
MAKPSKWSAVNCPECGNFASMMLRPVAVHTPSPDAFNFAGERFAVCGEAYANSNFDWLWACDDCGAFADDSDLTEVYGFDALIIALLVNAVDSDGVAS